MKKTVFLLVLIIPALSIFAQDDFTTYYEKSNFLETPRYKQTIEYSKKLANASEFITYQSFGKSLQGRDLPLLIVDKNKNFTPESVRESGNAILLVEACIHPGESEGKEAGFMLIRDIILNKKYDDLLENTTLLFIPIFNTDGHERFSPYSRINQNGPKEMGWRTNAQNLNLNRDFIKADAVEMQHWLNLFHSWLPDFFIDIHTTDGADYQYPLTYALPIMGEMNQDQTQWQKEYLNTIEKNLLEDDVLIFPYVSFRRWHDPRSGLVRRAFSARYSTGYAAFQNRPALLVETHMLKDYKTRVDATYHTLKHTFNYLDENHEKLHVINQEADEESKNLAGKELVLSHYTSREDSTMVEFKGVDYEMVPSDLTDGNWVKFSDQPKNYELVLFDVLKPDAKATVPNRYIIPVEWTEVIERIKLHGIEYTILEETKEIEVETYKFSKVQFASSPYEGRQMVRDFEMEPIRIKKKFYPGSMVISTKQRSAKMIAQMLEPAGPDSYVRWGFFNSIFERKEYVETYVMEKMAREMIKENPQLLDEYKKAVEENPEVYNNQWAKLFWFYALTPYWDDQKDVYPVGKIYQAEFEGPCFF